MTDHLALTMVTASMLLLLDGALVVSVLLMLVTVAVGVVPLLEATAVPVRRSR